MAARAATFISDWAGEQRERAEKDSFWNEFFGIFGISRRRVGGVFEYVARRHSTGRHGFMDLFWPGHIAVEHKSAGADLTAAMDQLVDYLSSVDEVDFPLLAVVCDFKTFIVRDLDAGTQATFPLEDLSHHLDTFAFLAGYSRRSVPVDEEQANLEATELLTRLHDRLASYGYPAHDLRVLLVRILYILFADDTQIWPKNLFEDFVRVKTAPDGSDLGSKLRDIFDVLNDDHRMSNLDPTLAEFEYVNGGLFAETIRTPTCDAEVRQDLLRACQFEWSTISPVIFGSLFQNVMTSPERRRLGAHFTTERDILRTLRPLFLDALEDELKTAKDAVSGRLQRLREFRAKLPTLHFLDPACGCGNFLMVAFRELRRLELDVQIAIREAEGSGHHGEVFDISLLRQVGLNQFHGIEIEEFPARIAETALHLADHQANLEMSAAFGHYVPSLPLSNSANIEVGNALRMDWSSVVPANDVTYVVGNPPFVGISLREAEQTADLQLVWGQDYHGTLDYVTGWYRKVIDYVGNRDTRVAFVSTNSISQGEQVAPLWGPLLDAGFRIDFAHRTFAWVSEARGGAHVHVVVIGISQERTRSRGHRLSLYDYPSIKGDPTRLSVTRINPYLVEGPDLLITSRSKPLSPDLPEVRYGNKPTDDGGFVVKKEELAEFLADPIAAKYVRRYIGARELIHAKERWCLWLAGADPVDLRASQLLADRIAVVRAYRDQSAALSTREAARTSHLFRQITQPTADFVCIPIHGSGERLYLPVQTLPRDVVASNATFIADDPTGLLFAVISSSWFMAWQNAVGGRIKSDPRFNKLLVWNTFPMPRLTQSHAAKIIAAGRGILSARQLLDGQSLHDMYDSSTMNPRLLAAHEALDRALDKVLAPRRRIRAEVDRVSVLFDLYQRLLNEGQLAL